MTPNPRAQSQPEPGPIPVAPPVPTKPCPPDENTRFYCALRPYEPIYDDTTYQQLHQALLASTLPGTDDIAARMNLEWNVLQYRTEIFAGWAYQGQRALYYHRHGLAIATNVQGLPDIEVHWNTGGEPARIEAVETKFAADGLGFVDSLQRPRDRGSELARYQTQYPGKWLLEVNKLDPSEAIRLQNIGGVPFNIVLYP